MEEVALLVEFELEVEPDAELLDEGLFPETVGFEDEVGSVNSTSPSASP